MAQVPREQRVAGRHTSVVVQHQTAAVATGNGVDVDIRDCSSGIVQVEGITTGTVIFEATVDGVTWVSIAGRAVDDTNQSGAVAVSTLTADGMVYFNNLGGVLFIRARISVWTTGTFNVWGSYY